MPKEALLDTEEQNAWSVSGMDSKTRIQMIVVKINYPGALDLFHVWILIHS